MKRLKILDKYDVIVIGGGAAGMFSAGTAASCHKRVLLLEKNRDCGKKLRITGKGRCNVTNNCLPEEVMKNVPTNPKFLYSSVYGFTPEDAMAFFESHGVPLKTERGNRVFPVSDKAEDIVSALRRYLREQRVTVLQETAERLLLENGIVRGVVTNKGEYYAQSVILATGGCSYPLTGSDGSGYELACQAGHTVTAVAGSLVPVEIMGGECRKMAGLSLRNTGVKLYGKGKKAVYQDFGELLFMNYGMSGPTILSASAHMKPKNGPFRIVLDLKPALDEKMLDARILRDFEERKNENAYEGLRKLLPAQMIPGILDRCEIPSGKTVNTITREERLRLRETIKALEFQVVGKRPVEEAIITTGGVKVSEINPATMESKLVSGLYFAGEIIDCDAYTGGFNLQIAWSTGYAAGTSCGNV